MNPSAIVDLFPWEALDSRGNPTVACEVRLAGGARGVAVAPSGASTGAHEARELRDEEPRYGGLGVRRAVEGLRREVAPRIAGSDAADQEGLDRLLCTIDETPDLHALGGNAVLAVSVAAALAAAQSAGMPLYQWVAGETDHVLPLPMINVVSGGLHAGWAIDLQDILVVPIGARSFAESIEWAWRVRRAARDLLEQRGLPAALVADEGGLGAPLGSNTDALELVATAIERSGLKPGDDACIGLDVAANQLAADGGYWLPAEARTVHRLEFLEEICSWCQRYPIVSVEDPLPEDEWDDWTEATRLLEGRVQLIGDDVFATHLERLDQGIAQGVANAVLVKPNQSGTLSGAAAFLERARDAGYATVVSARSGDTEDSWLADLAVGWNAGQIKVGSLARSERTAKWNRLLRIEAELGASAGFAGAGALRRRRRQQ